jgi:predicted MPP superfamily phosphohydrolase
MYISTRSLITLSLTILFSVPAVSFTQKTIAGTINITGQVFEDINKNGVKENNEPGISDVVISDQVEVVQTDKNGLYQINARNSNRIIFISVPSGYKTSGSFYIQIKTEAANQSVDFPLIKIPLQNEFLFIHASDTHISNSSISRMQKLKNKIDSVKPSFVIVSGDRGKDALRVPEKEALGYYNLYKQETEKIQTPIWNIPGNHEIFGIERHLSLVSKDNPYYGRKMYYHFLGPDYYSFNFNGIHFIGLNSLSYDDLYYYGYIDSTQIEWLKKDIALVDPKTSIVTFQHVPFYSGGFSFDNFELTGANRTVETVHGVLQNRHIVSNAGDVMKVLQKRNYPLALAGHYHAQQKFSLYGVQTRFEQTGAVIGPNMKETFVMPSGVTVYRVKNGKIDEGVFVELE